MIHPPLGRWLRLAAGACALGLPGCGEETFPTPPDCDGRRMAAYGRRVPGAGSADIFLFDFDGNGYHRIPSLNDATLNDLNPSLSSDGRFIAFERELTPGGDADVLIYDRCLDLVQPQPGLNSVAYEGQPAFSYDGLRLAFVRDTLGRRRVRLYSGSSDRLVPLPALDNTMAYADSAPSLNADGTVIAFVSSRNGNADIYVYDVTADTLRDLPDLRSDASDVDPFLSPDGKYLVFASDRTGGVGGYDLYLYDLQTRSFTAVAPALNSTATERSPSINVTTDRIVFASDRTGGLGALDIWLHTRSTTEVQRASASSAVNDVQPWIVWQ